MTTEDDWDIYAAMLDEDDSTYAFDDKDYLVVVDKKKKKQKTYKKGGTKRCEKTTKGEKA